MGENSLLWAYSFGQNLSFSTFMLSGGKGGVLQRPFLPDCLFEVFIISRDSIRQPDWISFPLSVEGSLNFGLM